MTTRFPVSLVILLLLVPRAPLFAQPDVCGTLSQLVWEEDYLHPKWFISVDEIRGERNKSRTIYEAPPLNSPSGGPNRNAFVEVDHNSIISIGFVRENISNNPDFESNVRVTGTLNKQPIEIPGYSLLGKDESQQRITISSVASLQRWACGTLVAAENALASSTNLSREIDRIRAAQVDQAARMRETADRLRDARRQRDNLQAEIAQATSDTARQDLSELNDRLNSTNSTIEDLERQHQAHQARFTEQVAEAQIDLAIRSWAQLLEWLNEYRSGPTSDWPRRLAISSLNEAELSAVIDALRRVVPPAIGDIRTNLQAPQVVAITEPVRLRRDLERLIVGLNGFIASQRPSARIDRTAASRLIDTEINLASVGAKSGDQIVLSFENALDATNHLNRRMDLLLRVRRFGWVLDVNDAFMFIRRLDANYEREPLAIQKARASIEAGQTLNIEVPAGVNFDVTPGASLTWTLHDRNRNNFWGWLKPGFGIHIAFPKFETIDYVVSLPPGVTDKSQVSIREERRNDNFDIGTGGIVTLFDSAIGVTFGYNVTSELAPKYWGISFSFVSLAKRAAQLLPSQ